MNAANFIEYVAGEEEKILANICGIFAQPQFGKTFKELLIPTALHRNTDSFANIVISCLENSTWIPAQRIEDYP